MKKLLVSLVLVKKITSTVPRSNFAERDLEKLAQLILELGGLINPIILRRNGMDSYEIVEGDFEYYAAAKAREINPMKGETIGAFILEPENEGLLLEQVQALRKSAKTENLVELPETGFFEENTSSQSADSIKNPVSLVEVPKSCENETPQSSSSLEQRLTNLEAQFENQINELKAEYAREKQVLAQSIQEVENRILQQVSLLVEAGLANRINELNSESPTEKQVLVERIPQVENVASESMSALEALNSLDQSALFANFKDAGLKLPVIKTIIQQRGVRQFTSFANVVERVDKLGDKTMIKIIDKWQKYS
ncbi:ParB N-terminal domain-containing protein [Microcoleus sp. MON1_C5]|uniref:ParB N-terminal domain-containing protein n=1 Tax=Microcoleus sp. MON1_C5 TaxID=2818828 RepID=UPI00403F6639